MNISIKVRHGLIFMNPIMFGLETVSAKCAKSKTQRLAGKIARTCGNTMLRRRKTDVTVNLMKCGCQTFHSTMFGFLEGYFCSQKYSPSNKVIPVQTLDTRDN